MGYTIRSATVLWAKVSLKTQKEKRNTHKATFLRSV